MTHRELLEIVEEAKRASAQPWSVDPLDALLIVLKRRLADEPPEVGGAPV